MEQQIGYSVITDELTGFARRTGHLAGELARLARHEVRSVRTMPAGSLGEIGKETGFTAALHSFAGALERQVDGVARNAATLGDGVSRTARTYRERDEETAAHIIELIG